ncbi:c-type cytochrome biogenesis protein CcmI [Roseateles sp. BYS96W]|uniref:C-type cytochrome biogenesis protein CcmI n=1 Tax=Pelomonas nitida TaxID=3299027 RepID=A0ABW7GD65_9BURK
MTSTLWPLWPLWAVALTLLLLALAGLLWPLLREPGHAPADARQRLRELYRHKHAELDQEALSPAERQQALDELQLALLHDLDAAGPAPARCDGPWHRHLPAALLSVALPVAALALYLHAGDPRAVAELARAEPAMHESGGTQVETAVQKLAERLRTDPDDLQGWLVLARSQETMEHFDDAVQSFRQAIAAAERQQAPAGLLARLHADLADALASTQGGELGGPAQQAIAAALALQADQPKALALAGASALRRGDVGDARQHWQRLLGLLEPGSPLALRVEADLQRLAEPAPTAPTNPPAAAQLGARITVDAALAARLPPQATVFVVVRPAGERMPAAVLRLRASELPAEVAIDDRHAMSPERPPSRFERVTVQARISLSGQATRQPGDWSSAELPARRGQQGLVLHVGAPAQQQP